MEEKTIVVGKLVKPIWILLYGVCLFAFAVVFYFLNIDNCQYLDITFSSGTEYYYHYDLIDNLILSGTKIGNLLVFIFGWFGIVITALGILFFFAYRNTSITVTDKRVFGSAAWNKRVDLPFDMISAVGTSFLKGISVATSSGKISFKAIANNNEVHEAISKLLIDRQGTNSAAHEKTQSNSFSGAEKLKRYKDLLDSGVITQEEFEAKKKQLLGL